MVASSCDSFFLCLSIAAFFFNVVIVCCCGCVFLLLFCLVVVVCADRLPVVDRIPASPRVGRKKKQNVVNDLAKASWRWKEKNIDASKEAAFVLLWCFLVVIFCVGIVLFAVI